MTAPQAGAMTAAQYSAQQQAISTEATAAILVVLQQFQAQEVTPSLWNEILKALFGIVNKFRNQSAILGRTFYDSQRILHVGMPEPVDLPPYKPEWFAETMQPAYKSFRVQKASDGAVVQTLFRALKEVENGGRRTIMNAVREDKVAVGWARIATGRETCAFCMMLVSRGPSYNSARGAGLKTDDKSAADILDRGNNAALDELMTRWHPGCDCKVVPVYDEDNWPGRDAYLKAEKLWYTATKGYGGRDALNALRRALDNGEVNPGDFAIAA